MDNLQVIAANTALKKMFSDGHFSICTIDKILKVTGGVPDKYHYEILNLLHCVNFSAMPSEIRSELPNLLQKVLGSDQISFELRGQISKPESIIDVPSSKKNSILGYLTARI